jgi:predicted HD phosphohydrolase
LLSATERGAFESSPHCAAAVRLRRWDDAAKVVGLATPPLEHFAAFVDRSAT